MAQTLPLPLTPAEPAALTTCASCQWWRRTTPRMITAGDGVPRPIGNTVGECHCGHPVASYVWPRTYAEDWCGEWATKGAASAPATRRARA